MADPASHGTTVTVLVDGAATECAIQRGPQAVHDVRHVADPTVAA